MITGDLSKSHYLKSCPNCSQREGYLVFKPYPEAFGESKKRSKGGAQSWCQECRTKQLPHKDER